MLKTILFLLLACGTAAAQTNISEIEPNDNIASADSSAIVINGDTVISGSIGAVGDVDIFRIAVASERVLRLETTNPTLIDCDTFTTTLRLYGATGIALNSDNTSGMRSCSSIQVALAPGTYYVGVEESGNNAAIPAYSLLVNSVPNGGVEIEPNETIPTASALGILPRFISGDHNTPTDSDFYSITLSQPASIRLEIIEGDASETCESNGIDSHISLFDAGGAQLVSDDDSGRGFCSAIDGRGTSPQHSAAANLPAGTYYVRVRASSLGTGGGAIFNYRLIVQLPSRITTAAGVYVGGRAVTPSGRGVSNAVITLTNSAGTIRWSRTTPLGFFGFDGVEAGQTYIVNGSSKSYVFAPLVIFAGDNSTDLILQSLRNF